MKILSLTKWPPIEGGVSAYSYWFNKGLGKLGHKVFVVTNSYEVEESHRCKIPFDELHLYQPKGIKVHSTHPFDDDKHIPDSKEYTVRLSGLALETVESYDPDVMGAEYFLPYGMAAHLVNKSTKLPYILKNAGSDITRLMKSQFLYPAFREMFKSASLILTSYPIREKFFGAGVKEKKLRYYKYLDIDTAEFNPNGPVLKEIREPGKPVVLSIGKTDESKGTFRLIEALGKVKEDFTFLIVTDRKRRSSIDRAIKENGIEKNTIVMDFVAPWNVPTIYRTADLVVCGEHDFAVPIHSPRIAREAAACGIPTLLSNWLYSKFPYSEMEDGKNTILFNPKDEDEFVDKLKRALRDPDQLEKIGKEARKFSEQHENFNGALKHYVSLFREAARNA